MVEAAAQSDQEIIKNVMSNIEAFYFDDGDTSGEKVFNEFASKHQHLFEDGCDAEEMENKLE